MIMRSSCPYPWPWHNRASSPSMRNVSGSWWKRSGSFQRTWQSTAKCACQDGRWVNGSCPFTSWKGGSKELCLFQMLFLCIVIWKVAMLMGKVFLQKSQVNLLSSVLDTPEFFWEQDVPDSCQMLYEKVDNQNLVPIILHCHYPRSHPSNVQIQVCEYRELEGRVEVRISVIVIVDCHPL